MKKTSRTVLARVGLLALAAGVTPVDAAELGVFGDIGFFDTDEADSSKSFTLGALDLYGVHEIDDRTSIMFELLFENLGEGVVVDLERWWIRRSFSERLTLAAGRFHAAVGYWNRTYHHGQLLQDTVSRPAFLEFEDAGNALLSMHAVGLMAMGDFSLGKGDLSYEFSIFNGPSIDTEDSAAFLAGSADSTAEIDINDFSDPNSDKSPSLRLQYAPAKDSYHLAVFGVYNVVAESGVNGLIPTGETLTNQSVLGFDFRYSTDRLELLGEYFDVENDNQVGTEGIGGPSADPSTNSARAYYLSVGYSFLPELKATYRLESTDYEQGDDYVALLGLVSADSHVLALRWDLGVNNALKFEMRRDDRQQSTQPKITTLSVQWAFMAL